LKFNYICLSFYIRAAIPFVFLHQGVIDMRIAYLLKWWFNELNNAIGSGGMEMHLRVLNSLNFTMYCFYSVQTYQQHLLAN